eukprot:CAMPEP_0181315458 /NCGR_PEP_ID=MMETSP1101-20121128/15389_1 /TAXON_ID=46948 /ORGANISM="Rhodomonas abbreviata, Strain Caron Lab Isolate" /LENGTH=168 /DNA_ID=CAMNT_0023422673 /DNA_START=12 /DNA_END=518 /DNA_ORIENTATION=+
MPTDASGSSKKSGSYISRMISKLSFKKDKKTDEGGAGTSNGGTSPKRNSHRDPLEEREQKLTKMQNELLAMVSEGQKAGTVKMVGAGSAVKNPSDCRETRVQQMEKELLAMVQDANKSGTIKMTDPTAAGANAPAVPPERSAKLQKMEEELMALVCAREKSGSIQVLH